MTTHIKLGTAANEPACRDGTMQAIVQDGYGSVDVLRPAGSPGRRSPRTKC